MYVSAEGTFEGVCSVCVRACVRALQQHKLCVFFQNTKRREQSERSGETFDLMQAVIPLSVWVSETGETFRNLCLPAGVVGFHPPSLTHLLLQPPI